MDQQKYQYFQILSRSNSPKAKHISSTLTSQQLQQLCNEPNFNVQSSSNTINNNSSLDQRLKPTKQIATKGGPNMERLTQLSQGRYRKSNTLRPIKTEDQIINGYRADINDLRKKRKQYEQIKPTITEQLRKLKAEKQIAASIRREQQIERQIEYQKKLKAQRVCSEQRKNEEKNKKLEAIEQKLQNISEQKQKREHILSSHSVSSLPKYKVMEKRFLMQQLRDEVEKKIYSKRLHESRYKNYLEHQSSSRIHSQNSVIQRVKTEIASERRSEENELKEKRKQMMYLLEEKRKRRAIKVNPEMSHQVQIARDKALNPQKYHFLKMKNLTDDQIFKQFQDFQMNFDNKQLGNQYLTESKAHLKRPVDHAEVKHSHKIQQSSVGVSPAKQESVIKPEHLNKQKEQISRILRGSESKSKVLELLSQQSLNNSRNIVELESQLLKPSQYQECLNIQSSIDKEYLNFLKSKIVSLGLQLQ